MSKESIIKLLENNKNMYLSGQKIANFLGISRNAVWKNINSLKAEGFEILSAKQGYMLIDDAKEISTSAIKSKLSFPLSIYLYPSLDSTNSFAISNIASLTMPSLIIALEQTTGRGRLGKSFSSKKNNGIYMSFIFENSPSVKNIHLITALSAVAVARATKNLLDEDLKIKWVNDLFRGSLKACGILTEGITNFETGSISHIVIGIGINTGTKAFSGELKNIATSISDKNINKNLLISEIAKELHSLYRNLQEGDISFMDEYRNSSLILGKPIKFKAFDKDEFIKGKALSIDDNGSLNIELESGQIVNVSSGEVSVTPI